MAFKILIIKNTFYFNITGAFVQNVDSRSQYKDKPDESEKSQLPPVHKSEYATTVSRKIITNLL